MYKANGRFFEEFITSNVSGVATNADAVPGGMLVRNTADDTAVQVYVSNVDVGRYRVSGVIPSTYNQYDVVHLYVSGYIATSYVKSVFSFGMLDAADWSLAERNQLRYKLGIDGMAVIPTSGIGHIELSPSGVEQITIETGINMRQATSVNSAALAGISSGTGPWIYYQAAGNPLTGRIAASAISGIRTQVNVTL